MDEDPFLQWLSEFGPCLDDVAQRLRLEQIRVEAEREQLHQLRREDYIRRNLQLAAAIGQTLMWQAQQYLGDKK